MGRPASQKGCSALHVAASYGHDEVVNELIVACGMDRDARDGVSDLVKSVRVKAGFILLCSPN
jgi:hypothetical protein